MSDLISRQDAIDALGEEPPVWYDGDDEIAERNQWRRDKAAIKSLPSAEPKTGEWEFDEDEGEYICSECKRLADVDTTTGEWVLSRYCGDCGAYMVNNNSVIER